MTLDGDKTRQPQDQYRLLLGAITDYGIYMLSPEGFITSWNPGAQRLKGYSEDEVLGTHFSRFYPDADRLAGAPQRALATAVAEGRFESEGWRVRKDGTTFWAHVVIDPIRGNDGELLGFAKITRDLTERKSSERALDQSEDQFRRLVQAVTDYALYMLSPKGLVTNWNAGAERIKGYRAEEIIGRSFATFYTEEDRLAGEPQRALRIAEAEGRYEKEGWRIRKDGSRFLAHVIIDAIRGDRGELLGFAKITRDVSERAAAQRQLEVAREQLLQSQKMEAIGQLTGGVAHDFNNLLMAVLSSLEMLRKRLPDNDPQLLSLVDTARQGAERGASLTNRMLAFARRQDLRVEAIDLAQLVHGVSDLIERSVGPAVEVRMRFPTGLSHVLADANQLETAILNLAINARDAMPGGGVLSIEASESEVKETVDLRPGRYVRLSVTDNGEGMDPATVTRAIEPFFTTKGVGKGTGLGLSMVHGMVKQSGGDLVVRSTAGAGTTVELWLPVTTDQASEPEPREIATEPRSAEGRQKLNILVVDDDPLILMNTAEMLRDLGHEVAEAISGQEALGLLREAPFDLVITDHAMPKMTGSQLATAIRTQWPDLPIILATGYAELPQDGSAALPRLSKPFLQAELSKAVDRAMAGSSPA